jgi:hypothetical protein
MSIANDSDPLLELCRVSRAKHQKEERGDLPWLAKLFEWALFE